MTMGRIAIALIGWTLFIGATLALGEEQVICRSTRLDTKNSGELDRVIAACTNQIRRSAKGSIDYADALYKRAEVYRARRDYPRAIQDYNELLRLTPDGESASDRQFKSRWVVDRGLAYVGRKRYDQAIADFTEALRLDPENTDAFYHRGQTYERKGNYDQAIKDYGEAIRTNPKEDAAFLSRGSAYLDKGHYDKAIDDFTEALRLTANVTSPWMELNIANRRIRATTFGLRALAYVEKGDCARAEADRVAANALAGAGDIKLAEFKC